MAEFPAMPFWTDAYLADTRHLSDAEHGRYLLLLMDMWRSPGCRFPNDRAWLERKFRRSSEAFEAEIMPILKEFCQCDGNWWTQKKLLSIWKQVQENVRKQSARAKSRWNKEKNECRGNAAPALPTKTKTITLDIPPPPSEVTPLHASPNGSAGKPKVDARGTRLSQDWEPGEKGVEYARKLGMSDDAINATYHAFMRYWLAKAGKDARKVDWGLTWQTWVRREHERLREQADREARWRERYGARAPH